MGPKIWLSKKHVKFKYILNLLKGYEYSKII